MTRVTAYAIALAAAALAGWVVPALTMRALAPSLEASPLASENFRGRRVFLGLGLVWVVWTVVLFAASTAFDVVSTAMNVAYGTTEMLLFEAFTLPLYVVPIILVLGTAAFGMADDVFGTPGDKGFRGHLKALFGGRLSTGGLKLLGIGVVAAVHAWRAGPAQGDPGTSAVILVAWWIAGTLVIALSANLVNLLDLRPGRALKAYSVMAVAAAAVFVVGNVPRYTELVSQAGLGWTSSDTLVIFSSLVIVLLGPALAVWKYDLGEAGMLGDAGSNVMGAIVGYLLVRSLPFPWLAAVAVVLLGLNLLSELVSFSALIDRFAPLAFIDRLGRLPEDAGGNTKRGAS